MRLECDVTYCSLSQKIRPLRSFRPKPPLAHYVLPLFPCPARGALSWKPICAHLPIPFAEAIVDIHPHAGPTNCDLVVEALKWCIRNNIPTTYVDLWHEVKKHFDRALEKSWTLASAMGCSPSSWFDLRKAEILAVCPAQIQRLFEVNTGESWADLVDELTVVVTQSALGKRIFEVHYNGVSEQRLSKYIDQVVHSLLAKGFSASTMKEAKELMRSKACSLGKDFYEKHIPRSVSVEYRGLKYMHRAVSFADEAQHKLSAALKAHVEHGVSSALVFESKGHVPHKPCRDMLVFGPLDVGLF